MVQRESNTIFPSSHKMRRFGCCTKSGLTSFRIFCSPWCCHWCSQGNIWRTPKETYNPNCLVPTVKHGGGSVMVWAAISWYSAGPITLHDRITGDYVDILGNQVHPVIQTIFPSGNAVFQDDNAPILTSRAVQSWFEEHESELNYLPWSAQSPSLNIIEPLWSV